MEQENNVCASGSSDSSDQLLAEGKRCLAAGDTIGAVEYFQEACGLLASVHGQVSLELAEPYYLYGKALLELARGNSSVLGSGIPVPEDKPSSSDEEEENEDVEVPNELISSPGGEGPVETAANKPPESSEPDGNNEPVSSSTNGEAPEANEDKEEESDLQIAWEVLELARVICQRVERDDYRLKLSDVNLLLGEVGMESDQYEQAILDMQSCLQLRQFVLDSTDRRIAEVYFSLGLAYTLNKQFDEAIAAYRKSKETLQKRKAELEGQLSSSEDENEKLESEIKELSDLLPDIDSKILDVGEMKRLVEERVKEEEETSVGFEKVDSKEAERSETVAVTDISHLIRKRPAVTADEPGQPSAKKSCTVLSSDVAENGKGMCSDCAATACEQ